MEREKTELRNCQNDSPTERNSCVLLKKEKVVGITKVMNIHCLGESDYKNQSTHSWTISVFEANQVVSIPHQPHGWEQHQQPSPVIDWWRVRKWPAPTLSHLPLLLLSNKDKTQTDILLLLYFPPLLSISSLNAVHQHFEVTLFKTQTHSVGLTTNTILIILYKKTVVKLLRFYYCRERYKKHINILIYQLNVFEYVWLN